MFMNWKIKCEYYFYDKDIFLFDWDIKKIYIWVSKIYIEFLDLI